MVDIVAAGNSLVSKSGGLGESLFQFQEHEFRKLTEQRQYIMEQSQWIPSVAEEMKEVVKIGVNASYSRQPPASPRRRGLPYMAKDTEEITQKLRRDVKKGRMFICGKEVIG